MVGTHPPSVLHAFTASQCACAQVNHPTNPCGASSCEEALSREIAELLSRWGVGALLWGLLRAIHWSLEARSQKACLQAWWVGGTSLAVP